MRMAVIFDCEFLTAGGAPQRFWCGPHDPDPIVVQIGAVRLGLSDDFPMLDAHRSHVVPRDRLGAPITVDPLLTRLTGITDERLRTEGVPLDQALLDLDRFANGAPFWSWGKDEFNLLAISCYVAGFPPPIPARRFGNACRLVLAAGMPIEDVHRTRSNTLADQLGVDHPPLDAHDALDDARSVAYALQALLRDGRLDPERLLPPPMMA